MHAEHSTTISGASYIDGLDKDLILLLFFFAGWKCLNSMSRTCYSFYSVLEDARLAIKDLLDVDLFASAQANWASSTDVLCIRSYENFVGLRALTFAPLHERKSIHFCLPYRCASLWSFGQHLDLMTNLAIKGITDLFFNSMDDSVATLILNHSGFMSNFRSIRLLHLTGMNPSLFHNIEFLPPPLKKLESFVCLEWSPVKGELFKFLAESTPQLSHLSLHNGGFDDDALSSHGIESVCDNIGKLKCLECLKFVSMLDEEDTAMPFLVPLLYVTPMLKHIKEINFAGNRILYIDKIELYSLVDNLLGKKGWKGKFYLHSTQPSDNDDDEEEELGDEEDEGGGGADLVGLPHWHQE